VVSDRWSDRVEHPTALPQLTAHADARCVADSVRHLTQSHPSPEYRLPSSCASVVSRSRLTTDAPAARLPARHTTPLPHRARVCLLTGAHLDHHSDTTPQTTARNPRRIMTHLHDLGLVTILKRGIGGVRAGSAGHVIALTVAEINDYSTYSPVNTGLLTTTCARPWGNNATKHAPVGSTTEPDSSGKQDKPEHHD
jgi:hypothetical protein